jgi:hypothetical protein
MVIDSQIQDEIKLLCPVCGQWLGSATKTSICKNIKIYCKRCKKQQPLVCHVPGK